MMFFFKQKTAYEMRISDWSSDVCSSDLLEVIEVGILQGVVEARRDAVDRPGNGIRLVAAHDEAADLLLVIGQAVGIAPGRQLRRHAGDRLGHHVLVLEIGRASCRARGCQYV